MSEEKPTLSWAEAREEGNLAFKASRFDDAVEWYSKAIALNPEEATLFSNRSAAYLKKGDFENATRDACSAVRVDETFAKAYSRLHNALCNLGRFNEAVQKLSSGADVLEAANAPKEEIKHLRELQADAERAQKALDLGRQCVEACDLPGAVRVLLPMTQAFPDCAALSFLLAEARAPREPDEVTRALVHFNRSHSNDPSYLYVRALASYYRGQDGLKTARVLLREALDMDPDNSVVALLMKKIRLIESHKENGNTAFKEKRYKDAIQEYASAIELDSSNIRMVSVLRGNQAAAKMELKEYSSALLDCDFVINNGLGTAKLYARRGRIQEILENYDDAMRDLQRAAEQDHLYEKELNQLKSRAKKAKRKDYYKILGLSKDEADDAAIKRSYKKACLQWHPDKWANATEEERIRAEKMFKEVGEAFSILSDPQKKRMYDNGQLDNAVEGASNGGFHGSNEDLMNVMNMMFGGGPGFPGAGGVGGFPGSGFGFSTRQTGGLRGQQKFSFNYF